MTPTLPTCASCASALTWKEALFMQRFLQNHNRCPRCGAVQYIKTRKPALFVTVIMAVSPLTVNLFTEVTIPLAIVLYTILIPLLVTVSPFTYELSDDDPLMKS
ncbi:TIGR04104 family putative zinc finger protein [Salisediminibacterium selenitireducens]|uniref:Cxxc_20_cxxc protein n=1 Tax=Bacillus selenitireducens (strain ATCC 700615 / DSM 15326 / MLS10) TaxID=439292 RepID=D6XWG1_BACIE|nr:TIGR04104 family putative zinc finger protein [Salisediminibacterium selenitireducens]ADH97803.1 hypothetical protein Bsel_0261 [[Bacillus] selenitireducens MLS10]